MTARVLLSTVLAACLFGAACSHAMADDLGGLGGVIGGDVGKAINDTFTPVARDVVVGVTTGVGEVIGGPIGGAVGGYVGDQINERAAGESNPIGRPVTYDHPGAPPVTGYQANNFPPPPLPQAYAAPAPYQASALYCVMPGGHYFLQQPHYVGDNCVVQTTAGLLYGVATAQ